MLDELSDWADRPAVVRIGVLILLCCFTAVWAHETIERTGYDNPIAGKTTSAELRVADLYIAQSNSLDNWALALLGLTTAVVVTTRVHKSHLIEWLFVLLGPAFVSLLFSLRAGRFMRMRLTNLFAYDNMQEIGSVQDMLIHQATLFYFGLFFVALFATFFLVSIVAGTVKPYDEK